MNCLKMQDMDNGIFSINRFQYLLQSPGGLEAAH
jgi:hypothetical protein